MRTNQVKAIWKSQDNEGQFYVVLRFPDGTTQKVPLKEYTYQRLRVDT